MALAATRLIPMRKNKGKSIGACLHNHTSYIQNPDKTEQGELVSSYQCSPLTVDEEFLLTKESKPVSAPSLLYISVLLSRIAP